MTSRQISKNNIQTSSVNQPVIVSSPFTQLIARPGTTRFSWSNTPITASPPFNQLTRPGTMRLTWSNAKPELLNTEKGKRKHKAADEKDAKKTKNNIESLSNTSKQKLELEREKIDRDHRFQMEKLKVEKQKWKYKREKLRTSHELKMKKLELRLKQINNYK